MTTESEAAKIVETLQNWGKQLETLTKESFHTEEITSRLAPYFSTEELGLPITSAVENSLGKATSVGLSCAGADPTEEEVAELCRSINRAKLVGWVTHPLHKIAYNWFPPLDGPTLGELAKSIQDGTPMKEYKSERRCIIVSYPIFKE